MVDIEYANRIVGEPVSSERNEWCPVVPVGDDLIVFDPGGVLNLYFRRRVRNPFSDLLLAAYVEMYTFHHDVGIVNETGECPGSICIKDLEGEIDRRADLDAHGKL